MDWGAIILKVFAVLILVLLNGFFVAAEFALVKIRATQLDPLVAKNQRRAKIARRIVGEMNLDEILSTTHMAGKKTHIVKRGNSFLAIAAEYGTSLDSILHLNGMMELKNIQPGEELIVMPLDFQLLIEPHRKLVSIWDGGRFIREYPIIHLGVTGKLLPGKTKVSSKLAEFGGKQVAPQSKDYRASEKVILIAKPSLQIRGGGGTADPAAHGIVLRSEDMEEISLLTRVGNEVEIR